MVQNREAEMDQSLRSLKIHEKFHACHFPGKYGFLQKILGHKKNEKIIYKYTNFLMFCYSTGGWFLLDMDFRSHLCNRSISA